MTSVELGRRDDDNDDDDGDDDGKFAWRITITSPAEVDAAVTDNLVHEQS